MNPTPSHDAIRALLKQHPVVLFMKGTPDSPSCGFSRTVCTILSMYKVPYHAVNVLDDMLLRQDIKTFSDWPTIPQLYVNEEFIGGCDIVHDMHDANELTALFARVTSDA